MRVVYAEDALTDLEHILAYIAERSPDGAAVVAERIDAAVGTIALFPEASRSVRDMDVREHVVPGLPLLIVYLMSGELIEIVAVFHTSRNPDTKRYAD